MKANEIENYLKRFLEESSPYRCILINGSWGIGKTYEIKKVMETIDKKVYISLFGMQNLESLYSELVFQSIGLNRTCKFVQAIKQLDLPYGINKIASLATPKNILNHLIIKNKLVDHFIFFDDLERIGSNFPFDEFMGMVESIRLSNIKVILIANIDELAAENNNTFNKYSEKIIDKEYLIDKVSDELMKEQEKYNQDLINVFIRDHGIKNIRTLEKAQNLFEDVYSQIRCITKDNIKEQIRVACYAIVFEDVDQIYKKKLEEEKENKNDNNGFDIFYDAFKEFNYRVNYKYLNGTSFSSDIIESIIHYYLKHSNFNIQLLKIQYLEFLKSLKQKNYYKSTEEIRKVITESETIIRDEHLTLMQFIVKSNELIVWKEVLCQDCGEMLYLIETKGKEIIDRDIDISQSLDTQYIDSFHYHIESKALLVVIKNINTYIVNKYLDQIFVTIETMAQTDRFDLIRIKLKNLEEIIYQYKDNFAEYIEYLLKDYLLLKGNVSEDKVYCWRKIVKIAREINTEKFEKFIQQKLEEYKADKMFIHRTNQSLGK